MSTQPIHESSQLKDDSFENVLKGLESSSTGSQPQQPTHSEIKLPNQSSELRSGKRLSSSTSSSSRTKRSADHHQSEIEQISAPSSSPKRNSRARDDVNRNNDDNNGGNDDDDDVAAQQRSFRRQLEEDELKYGATHVIKLFVPVSLCMLMVVASVRSLTFYTKTNIYLPYTPYTDQTVDTTTRVWQSFANAFIVLLVVAFMTFVLIVFYKMRCYRLIHGWLLMSSIMLILMFVTGYTTGTRSN